MGDKGTPSRFDLKRNDRGSQTRFRCNPGVPVVQKSDLERGCPLFLFEGFVFFNRKEDNDNLCIVVSVLHHRIVLILFDSRRSRVD